MVLCVSAIINSPANQVADKIDVPDNQSLELTDGWYTIRANGDAPISRALKTGKLRLGSKIAISGAKVCSFGIERADAYLLKHALIVGCRSRGDRRLRSL